MRRSGLTAVGYSTAVMLALVPLGEAMAAVTPMKLGAAPWRFGAVGLFSRALLLALAGVVLASYIASASEHRRTLRVLAVLSGISSVTLLTISGVFALDALEMSATTTAVAKRAVQIASVSALVKIVAVGTVTALLARSAWKTSRSMAPAPDRRPNGMLISQPVPAND
jgi:hypothetical protein